MAWYSQIGKRIRLGALSVHTWRTPGSPHELVQPRSEPLQLPAAHRALLGDAITTLGKHAKFSVLRQKFHPHLGARAVPGIVQQRLLQTGEASLGRDHEVLHRRVIGTHLREHFLGGYAADLADPAVNLQTF